MPRAARVSMDDDARMRIRRAHEHHPQLRPWAARSSVYWPMPLSRPSSSMRGTERPLPKRVTALAQPGDPFPDTASNCLGRKQPAPGLLAAGGALDVDDAARAYSRGIFPWFSEGQPILWWSTDPRMVLFTDEFRLHRSLRKTLAKFRWTRRCEVRFDTPSPGDRACAAARATGSRAPGSCRTWCGLRRPSTRRPCAQRRDLDRRRAGGRPVLRGARPRGVRRIDVHARARRLQDRAGRAGGVVPRTGIE
jgi:hypothetical protein